MKFNVKVDDANLIRKLRNGDKRLAYAVVNALNDTAKKVQETMRERLGREFTLRQRAFMLRQVAKIDKTNFANVKRGQAWVEIAVGKPPSRPGSTVSVPLLLGGFEAGMERGPFVGKFVAVPVIGGSARPSKASKVPRAWTFERLQFHETETRAGRRVIVSANQNAYVVPGVGVFRRNGDGTTSLVYAFVASLTLDQRLEFVKTADKTARLWFPEFFEREKINAVARAG